MISDPNIIKALLNNRANRMMVATGSINFDMDDILKELVVRAAHCLPHESLSFIKHEIISMLDCALTFYLVKTAGNVHKSINSMMAESMATHQQAIAYDGKYLRISDLNIQNRLMLLLGLAASGRFEITVFESIFEEYGLNWQSLAELYAAKYNE